MLNSFPPSDVCAGPNSPRSSAPVAIRPASVMSNATALAGAPSPATAAADKRNLVRRFIDFPPGVSPASQPKRLPPVNQAAANRPPATAERNERHAERDERPAASARRYQQRAA